MVLYDGAMVSRAILPDEADDMTVSELHEYVLGRLVDVLRYLFGETALVLSDIFVRVDEVEQVAPDLLIVPSARRGRRAVYRIPHEPVPAVTLEVVSSANYEADGRRQLEHKRALLGRIGVPTHIEVDPERGIVTTWENTGHELVVGPPDTRYEGAALAGLRIVLEPGEVRLWLPDGREFVDAATEMARADATADRAERLADALRRAGGDPETV